MTWTQEQIDEAAERVLDVVLTHDGFRNAFLYLEHQRDAEMNKQVADAAKAAALAAQMPIAEVTEEEFDNFSSWISAGFRAATRIDMNNLLRNRNAPPKPDLRDLPEKICAEIYKEVGSINISRVITERILAIVKENQ